MIWKRVMQLEWKVLRRDKSVLLTLLVFGLFLVLASLSGGEQSRTLEERLSIELPFVVHVVEIVDETSF